MDEEQRRVEALERQAVTLAVAVEHRTTTGIALGMIMERLTLDRDPAFEYLSRCSQMQNVKLYDLALAMVETRSPTAWPPTRKPLDSCVIVAYS